MLKMELHNDQLLEYFAQKFLFCLSSIDVILIKPKKALVRRNIPRGDSRGVRAIKQSRDDRIKLPGAPRNVVAVKQFSR